MSSWWASNLILMFVSTCPKFTVSVGLDEQQLPSLTYLELSPCMFEKHLDHKMLQTLKIVSTLQHDDVPAVLLGQLPSLKTLHLTLNVHKTKASIATVLQADMTICQLIISSDTNEDKLISSLATNQGLQSRYDLVDVCCSKRMPWLTHLICTLSSYGDRWQHY